nr:hypothetical protein CFP56_63231 [Quercus suber]
MGLAPILLCTILYLHSFNLFLPVSSRFPDHSVSAVVEALGHIPAFKTAGFACSDHNDTSPPNTRLASSLLNPYVISYSGHLQLVGSVFLQDEQILWRILAASPEVLGNISGGWGCVLAGLKIWLVLQEEDTILLLYELLEARLRALEDEGFVLSCVWKLGFWIFVKLGFRKDDCV